MKLVRVALGVAMVLTVLAIVLGYLGALHPAADSLAVGRGIAAAALIVLAALGLGAGLMRWIALGSLVVAVTAGGPVALAYVWQGPPGTLSLYQKNMFFRNAELLGLEADIRAMAPVALTLQEVSRPNKALLEALRDMLPHQLHCPDQGRGSAVATSLVPVPGAEVCAPGLAAMQVMRDDKTLWIVSVHLYWPWPYRQADHTAALLPVLEGLEGPVVMGGDFNMVRWAWSVRALADAARVRPVGATAGTFARFSPWLWLPIDHVFAPRGGRVSPRGAFGSDHLGLVAQLEL
ncbi:endonuclease/exonuclease/phosphatase family protein [Tabrizicola sp.]|uniref:endonuclease/exonuclease/phosphatase family protein n=1 Tax=Tabrizicola sp. TaxID=2005166 RepID=UPI002614CEA9|nr:endonuclease/exonuclease/phosphatase family protein [Tabrizicola sp.]MDM7930429.1 hypothetical protein [Tabrizicola sp.]